MLPDKGACTLLFLEKFFFAFVVNSKFQSMGNFYEFPPSTKNLLQIGLGGLHVQIWHDGFACAASMKARSKYVLCNSRTTVSGEGGLDGLLILMMVVLLQFSGCV